MRRIGLAVFATLFGVLLFGIAFVAALSVSAPGTRWLIEFAAGAAPADIRISGISGTLLSGVHIDELHVGIGETSVDVVSIDMDPAWGASFFYDRLIVERLSADSVRVVTRGESQREPLAIDVPELPFAVDLRAVAIERVDLPEMTADFAPALRGRLSYDEKTYSLRQARAIAKAYEIDADLTLTATTDLPVSGTLVWRLMDPKASGKIKLGDTLRALDVVAQLDEPVPIEGRGRVHLLGEVEPRFDIDATVTNWADETIRVSDVVANVVGTFEHFAATAQGSVEVPDLPPAKLSAQVDGSIDALQVTRLVLTSEHGTAIAHGRIEREPLLVDLAIDATDLDPGLAATELVRCAVGCARCFAAG